MSDIAKGTESIVKGGVQFGEASATTLQGITGVFSPVAGLVAKAFKNLGKLLGGGTPRKKRSRHSRQGSVHSVKPVTTLKSPRRRRM